MNNKLVKKIVLSGQYQDVIKDDLGNFHMLNKFQKICVIPYTISSDGLLEQVGVIKKLNTLKDKLLYTLIGGYIFDNANTNLVAANALLFDIIGSNLKNAKQWMYLGNITNIEDGSDIILYAANITDVDIIDSAEVNEAKTANHFEMINSNKVVGSDDALFLASYLRLFNYFYVNSLQ